MCKSCLIIGLGNIGFGYDKNQNFKNFFLFSHAKSIKYHKKFNLVGGIDISQKKRAEFKKKYCVPVFKDTKDAFNYIRPDIIIIATTTNTHLKILLEIVQIYKPSTIICEKPMSGNFQDAKKILEICTKNKIKLFVNYFRVSDPISLIIKKMVKNYKENKLIKINAWYSKGLINNGSHLLNLFQFIFGKVVSLDIIKSDITKKKDLNPDIKIEFKKCIVVLRAAWGKNFSILDFDMLSSKYTR